MSNFLNSRLGTLVPSTKPTTKILAAMDIGSTQTRGVVFSKDAQIRSHLIVDSNYTILNHDIKHINSPGLNVIDNLEFVIADATANKAEKQFEEIHVAKGELLGTLTTSRQFTTSSSSKIDQQATYINAICNTTLLLLDYYKDNGKQEEAPDIHLTVALPPEDTKYEHRTNLFKERLCGTYAVEMPRFGISVVFNIAKDIQIISEPEAVAVFATVEGVTGDESDSVVCFLDIGGRSTGITFIDDNKLLVDSCETIPLGGTKLISTLGTNIARSYNIQEPQVTRLQRAVDTGIFRMGAQKLDVTEQLNAAKEEFAADIFNYLALAIDKNEIQMQNISKVYCSGRTFGETTGSPSLMKFIEESFKVKSPYTIFSTIDKSNPILLGLAYNGILHAEDKT